MFLNMFSGFGILWLIVMIAVIVAVIDIIRDTKMDGINKIIWLLIVILFNIIGTIIYFVVIKSASDKNMFKFGNKNS
ncbi:MAG: PLDc N-terminal domain-containing protein [bacterium]